MVGEFGMPPSEYREMTPAEVSIILEAKRNKMVGNIHEDVIDELVLRTEELKKKGIKVI